MDEYSEAQVNAFMRRFKLILIVGAAVVIVPVFGFWVYLDRQLNSLRQDLSYRPPSQVGEMTMEIDEIPFEPVVSQVVYVPAYSHIFHQSGKPVLLTITLSVRNTDRRQEVVIKSVKYYDTAGVEVKSYLEKPLRLGPLASTDFVVERRDSSGGSGANFIVEWVAGDEISEPVIEAVMIDTSGNQGISFVRPGTVIETMSRPAGS